MPDETPRDAAHWQEVEEAAELLHESKWQEALYALRDVLKASPQNPYAFFFLGHALYELGQMEPARDAYRAAVKLAPSYLGARVALAQVLRLLGDLRGAIAEAEIALRKAPGDADALYALGMAHAQRGDRDAAKRYLDRYLATNPEYESATEVREVLAELFGDGEDEDDEPS
jgi:tetratricopeptide (TPR) repeat protein